MKKFFTLILRLWKLLKPFHIDFYLQLLATVIQQAINVFNIYLAARILDSVVHERFYFAGEVVILVLAVTLVRILISYISDSHSQNKLDFAIQQYLEEYSFRKIFKLNISQYTEDHSAIKEQVINRGEMAIENIISMLVLTLLPTCTQILFAIIAISFYSKIVALWSLLALIFVVIWTNYFAKYHRQFLRKDLENSDRQKKVRMESFQHLSLIKTLGDEDTYLDRYLGNRQEMMNYRKFVYNMSLEHGNKRVAFFNASRAISSLAVVYLAYLGSLSVGSIYAVWSYINEANSQITNIIQAIRQLPIRFVELEKYLDVIDKEPAFTEEGKKPSIAGDITITNLTFKYPHGEAKLFDNISLVIPQGKTTAFVGISGSGKSTITRLLIRAYDYTEGSIKIGNIELKNINAKFLRQHIGYVEQHVDLFDDTVGENILAGIKKSNHAEGKKRLESIAHQARIDQFYGRLGEKKFDALIGERGVKLSGGERQRIGIARAIIKNPDILIFDEATSALDTENEAKVMEAINDVSVGKTTIIIAHRLSTVRNADKIIVMDKGRIVSEGTHGELMLASPIYQNLVAHQLS
jgi:ABC-type multidrug transport system fused ATPase/permease subunit